MFCTHKLVPLLQQWHQNKQLFSSPNYPELSLSSLPVVLSPELTLFIPPPSHKQALSDMVAIFIWKVETPTGHD